MGPGEDLFRDLAQFYQQKIVGLDYDGTAPSPVSGEYVLSPQKRHLPAAPNSPGEDLSAGEPAELAAAGKEQASKDGMECLGGEGIGEIGDAGASAGEMENIGQGGICHHEGAVPCRARGFLPPYGGGLALGTQWGIHQPMPPAPQASLPPEPPPARFFPVPVRPVLAPRGM